MEKLTKNVPRIEDTSGKKNRWFQLGSSVVKKTDDGPKTFSSIKKPLRFFKEGQYLGMLPEGANPQLDFSNSGSQICKHLYHEKIYIKKQIN